jgi:hypothetical protein
MDVREQLPLEQQFELKVFEQQIEELSPEDARILLVKLKESMLFQRVSFREILKDAWGIGKDVDFSSALLSEG